MAEFLVNSVLIIPGKSPVFISGTIINGEINMGDYLKQSTNKSSNIQGTISAIEFMDTKNGSFLCLGVECKNKEDQNTWLDLNIQEGDTLVAHKNT